MNASRPHKAQIAVVGAGIAAKGLAAALALGARARGRKLEITLFAGGSAPKLRPPALLTAECRARLAALGVRVPVEWKARELKAVEIFSGGRKERLLSSPGNLWVVDSDAEGTAGLARVAAMLEAVAALEGVQVVDRRVDRVTPDKVVWAHGVAQPFDAVALASGATESMGSRFFPGFDGAPTLPAVQGWIRFRAFHPGVSDCLRLVLHPLPGVDGLYLVPGSNGVYALAFGPAVAPADFCAAVMLAVRDGLLPELAQIEDVCLTRVPNGGGRVVAQAGQLAAGAAAFGHPLQVGLSETLACTSRAAIALLEHAGEPRMARRYLGEGVLPMLESADRAASCLGWLRRAGPRAASAFAAARRKDRYLAPFNGGILGLSSPTPAGLLASARWATVKQWLSPSELSPSRPPARPAEARLFYVVDDDGDVRDALAQLLEEHGGRVVTFPDETALLAAASRRPPAAILLDVVLNWVDGIRICSQLKRQPGTREIPVHLMSGLVHLRDRAVGAGANGFWPKPLDVSGLLGVLLGADPAPIQLIEPDRIAS